MRTAATSFKAEKRNATSIMIVRLFKAEFVPLIVTGIKTSTIRPTPHRLPKVGQTISLRVWTGKPYRSKQRLLLNSTITAVRQATIGAAWITLDGYPQSFDEREHLARIEGFKSAAELQAWFLRQYRALPFVGIQTEWKY